jgi:hypothetical protein
VIQHPSPGWLPAYLRAYFAFGLTPIYQDLTTINQPIHQSFNQSIIVLTRNANTASHHRRWNAFLILKSMHLFPSTSSEVIPNNIHIHPSKQNKLPNKQTTANSPHKQETQSP